VTFRPGRLGPGSLGIILGLVLLAGCADKNLVVVIPDSGDGHVGAVVVEAGGGKTLLNTAYAGATPGSGGAMKPVTSDVQQVNTIFGSALTAQPIAPKIYILYFVNDSDQLTPDSQPAFEKVFLDVKGRKAPELVVTGHTDTMGELRYNDMLSLERAKAVSKLFIAHGLPAESVSVAGRGKRELLIQTADNVPEPRNRRVEITVR
jgi:outer membrane protein OmpA-like peptidoglycan-associated protein